MNHRGVGAAAAAYRQAQVGGSTVVIVAALLEGALVALNLAAQAREAGRFDHELAQLDRVSRIMLGLNGALDRGRTWPLVARLEHFYLGASFRALAVPRQKDPLAANRRLAGQLRGMRDAWASLARGEIASSDGRGTAAGGDRNVIL